MKNFYSVLDVAMPVEEVTSSSAMPIIIVAIVVIAILLVAFFVINKKKNNGVKEAVVCGAPESVTETAETGKEE